MLLYVVRQFDVQAITNDFIILTIQLKNGHKVTSLSHSPSYQGLITILYSKNTPVSKQVEL